MDGLELIEVEAIASFSVFRKGQVYAVLSDDPMLKTGYLRRVDALADSGGMDPAGDSTPGVAVDRRTPEGIGDGPVESEQGSDAGDESQGRSAASVLGGPSDKDPGEEDSPEVPVASARIRKAAKWSTAV